MFKKFTFLRITLFYAAFLTSAAFATAQTAREHALRFLQQNPVKFNLTAADVADVRVTDEYTTRHNSITHVWVQQQYAGIPVYNALFGLHVRPGGEVFHLGHRFFPGVAAQVNTTLPSLSAAMAVKLAMNHLGFAGFPDPTVKEKKNEQNWVFDAGAVARSPIPVSICFQPVAEGRLRLAWSMTIEQANTADHWAIRVDAQTGEILDKNNFTVYCRAGGVHRSGEACDHSPVAAAPAQKVETAADEVYNIFALPAESPAHGSRQIVTNPAIPQASPYGWLDVNGATGAEYSYTRGNNVWAYSDATDDNTASPAESAQGVNGVFDFPYNPDAEPDVNRNAAITNLFYMNNMMHDINYLFGFDEEAGNFQVNNYGRGGSEGDEVRAEGLDGSGTNNANFSTPPDGANGRMQMYRWDRRGGTLVHVSAPSPVAGSYAASAASGWGAPITTDWVTGAGELYNDGLGNGTLGCDFAINDVGGKIVLIDRGECEFGAKAYNAQLSGAIGCIICNFEDQNITMGAGTVGGSVTIPVVMMTRTDCDKIRQFAANNVLQLSIGLPTLSGPDSLTGDFDNGIIAHEYGHGISNRLTGGPSASGCLGNDEQMGEGWSDFFTLVTSHRPGDTGTQRRGIGTYVGREANDGPGIRNYPYSTDMGIYPQTFSDVAAAGISTDGSVVPHDVGEIWASMLWDLYWAFVEKYGYDPDLSNTNSGNFKAIQLVMDGMKLQPCQPGFVDGRDAIVLADLLNYNGEDTCLIFSVFARRGLGPKADQGSSGVHTDGVADFDPIPTCIKELKITKQTFTPVLDPGGDAQIRITVTNHKDAAVSNVVVSDELPAGMTLNIATNGGTENNGFVVWNLGTLQSGQVVTLNYTAKTDPGKGSTSFFYDPMEVETNWLATEIDPLSIPNDFTLQSNDVKVGTKAWRVNNLNIPSDLGLEYDVAFTISPNRPVMRFWHNYITEPSNDAGIVEFRGAFDFVWRAVPEDKIFRAPYDNKVPYGTFVIPFLYGFSGNSNGWVQSYVDLSDYAGQDVAFRFRFGTNDTQAPANGRWIIDAVEMLEMFNYEGQACATSAEGDNVCADLAQRGIFMNPVSSSVEEPQANPLGIQVQPNPASDKVYLTSPVALSGRVSCQLFTSDGRLVREINLAEGLQAGQTVPFDVATLSAGMYLVRVQSAQGVATVKVVVR